MHVPSYKMKFFDKIYKVKQKVDDLTLDFTKKSQVIYQKHLT